MRNSPLLIFAAGFTLGAIIVYIFLRSKIEKQSQYFKASIEDYESHKNEVEHIHALNNSTLTKGIDLMVADSSIRLNTSADPVRTLFHDFYNCLNLSQSMVDWHRDRYRSDSAFYKHYLE